MRKLFAALLLLLPIACVAQTWPPTIMMYPPANTLYAQPDLNLVLRPVTAQMNFNNVVPWDKAEMFVCPPGGYTVGDDGAPSKFYSRTPLDIETCLNGTCNLYFNTPINWNGQGSPTLLTPSDKYPTGFEKLLPQGDYDVVWRIQRIPDGATQPDGSMAVKAGTFTIKGIDGMTPGTDDSDVEIKNNNTVFIYPPQGIFDDLGNSEIYIKLNKDVTNAAVFIGGKGADLKDSLFAASSNDAGAQIKEVPVALDALKSGVEIPPPSYVTTLDNRGLPIYRNQMLLNQYTNFHDSCMDIVLNEGQFAVTVVYMIGDNVYFKSAIYNVKYSTDVTTGITPVNAADVKIYLNAANNLNIDGKNVKEVKVFGLNGAGVYKGNSQYVNASGWPAGVYIVTVTTTDGRGAVQKVIKK
ncbi:MAG: T9SS type A sorting domain-containing protein [Elusimicrobia bacterium]|nr:T9SS type A sorting domain-containing protein [Elusimicrobiota bacterium]